MDESIRDDILSRRPKPPIWLIGVLILLVLVGLVVFISAAAGSNSQEAWQIYLVNFIFWTGLALGGITFSCALRITSGRWGRPLLRVSEALGSFLPVSFILLLILLFIGSHHVLPYASHHYHHPKDTWLNMSFVSARNIVGFLVVFILSAAYVYYSLRQDLGGAGEKLSGLCARIASGWKGEEERVGCWNKLSKLSVAVTLAYVVVLSIISWDFMMSLDPHWFSTLFGPYYFISSLLAAMGATIIFSTFTRKHLKLQEYITQFQFYDIGKLLLGFSMFWVYLMFSQFLAIWYANMPEETGFVIARTRVEPFRSLSWVVLSCCFFFPFISLIPRTNKVIPSILSFIASISFIGLWLNIFVLVTPSFSPEINFGLTQILVTLGYLAAFVLTFLFFIKTFPVIPVGDPLFSGKIGSHHHGGH